jgi:hypothetical protein
MFGTEMPRRRRWRCALAAAALGGTVAAAQVDQQRAAIYFKEAKSLCDRDGGRLWGVSLCGPIVIADAATKTIATNEEPPPAPRPAALGFANAAIDWGGTRWTTLVWQMMPADDHARGVLMVHELFHRIQPQLGLLLPEPTNDHLDTVDGRYWLQLEWRALAGALGAAGSERAAALGDALAFRTARHAKFPEARENERVLEINEGLPQYTGTVVASPSAAEAVSSAIAQLNDGPSRETFVRTFAYPSGAAYGLLLDSVSPGWTRRLQPGDDLARLVMAAAQVVPAADVDGAARRYGGPDLRAAEERRDVERTARIAELRKRFVDGPVLILPRPRSASFVTTGMTPIPGAGSIYPSYRTTAEWGTLEASSVLLSTDRSTIALPAPASIEGTTLKGDGWTLTLAPGWVVRPGSRAGDFQVVRE